MTSPGMTGWQGGLTAAQTFGGAPIEPEHIAAWAADNDRKVAQIESPERTDLVDVEAAPELDLVALGRELGAKLLLGVSSDPPAPLIVDRIDPDGHTIVFGDGGAGKGTIAASWAVSCAKLGMRTLIVDYENHPSEWSRRILGLGGDDARERVVHVAPLAPAWTLERGPIWHQARYLRALVKAAAVDVVIVDSIVMACAGADPMDTATVTSYSAAIELLERPVLSLAHTTKAGDLRYPFGSVFWHNLARTTWSLKRDGERAILSHRKRNNYASLGRFVVTATWRDDLPREVWEQGYSIVLADRIAEALAGETLTLEQLVDRLNADADEEGESVKSNSVRKALTRGIPHRFTIEGGRFRLAEAD